MRRGTHAADDGSFNRSAAVHTGRAAILLVVAVLIGVGLLHSADHSAVQIGTTGTVTPKKTTTTTAPTTTTSIATLRDPRTVKVLAANGTATNGVGDKVRRKLLSANYDALTAVTASTKVATTAVYFTPGFEGEAAALAVVLGLPATVAQAMPAKAPVPQLGTANLLVVAGTDIIPSLATATTTTAKAGTATTVRRATTTTLKSSATTVKTGATSTTTTTAKSSSSSSSSSSSTSTTRP